MSSKEQELADLRREQRILHKGRIAKDSENRLKRIAHKKFRTCFISALSEFEIAFGFDLWGHNLPENEITSEQKVNREMWDKVRKNILDKGNSQSRAFANEIDLYKIEFEGYRMNCGGISDGQ